MLKIPIDRSRFFMQYRRAFGALNQSQVTGLTQLLAFIEQDVKLTKDHRWVCYALATVMHETADTWHPIKEFGDKEYFLRRYWTNAKVRSRLGNRFPVDAIELYGRGYAQITGFRNYNNFSRVLGIDLIQNPDLALVPGNAYRILSIGMIQGEFTRKNLQRYINPTICNYLEARRIINGTDQAPLIAGYAKGFESCVESRP